MNKKALIIGKFMPLHKGHLALIHSTRALAQKITVLLCVEHAEPINGDDRERWLRNTFADDPQITIQRYDYSDADLPATSVSSRAVSELWTAILKTLIPDADLIVGSEAYVRYVAELWGIDYHIFDEQRITVPISATEIRANPYLHRKLLTPAARPDFVQKIVLHGTESTGKSTLTRHLADHFNTTYVPETAREIVGHTDTVTFADLLTIAERQAEAIQAALPQADGVLFIDTDVWSTVAYARYLFGRELPLQTNWLAAAKSALCLYCTAEAPYVQDGTRLEVAERLELDGFHRAARLESGVRVVEVGGADWVARTTRAIAAVRRQLGGRQ